MTDTFQRDLLLVLKNIVTELRESNKIARQSLKVAIETNKKFDNEIANLDETNNETIQQNRDITLGLKELNRSDR